ncbi:nucleotidyltransferase domain-containing protein [Promicromonospora sp. MEB111]|uniref:nucleotidyltransferase family protein n=1 Tax=Promicromonospora sp. MEB111 TaxID=3040301 RepID=UPI0025505CE6|nr:nucleotidyltransferase domain-containing protein [Promicromonospora sp. MEB111]
MDWNHPEHVFGSGLEPVILRTLWRAGAPMTGAEVHRIAGKGSVGGIRLALSRLALQGIVLTSRVGTAATHALNRDHLGFPAIDAAFSVLDPWTQFRSRVTEVVTEHGPDDPLSVTVAVFGSVARDEARLDSDVDLAVVVDEVDEHAQNLADELRQELSAATGQAVQVYLTTPARLRDAVNQGDPIVDSFRSDARAVSGPDIHTYLQEHR